MNSPQFMPWDWLPLPPPYPPIPRWVHYRIIKRTPVGRWLPP